MAAVFVVANCFWLLAPMCRDTPECLPTVSTQQGSTMVDVDSTPRNRAAAIAVLLMKEFCNLISAIWEAREQKLEAFTRWWQSLLLLCILLTVLLACEMVAIFEGKVWHAVPPLWPFDPSWRWMNSTRFVEWLINVPTVLTIACHYVLQRPLIEVVAPCIITDVYIVLAWLGLVVANSAARMVLIIASLLGFLLASACLIRSTCIFHTEHRASRGRWAREAVVVLLLLQFSSYGAVFLLGIFGRMASESEEEFYALNEFLIKLTLTFALFIVRAEERRDALHEVNSGVAALVAGFMPLMLRKFDYVLLGLLDPEPARLEITGELTAHEFEALLGRPVEGESFDELLDLEADRERFSDQLWRALGPQAAADCSGQTYLLRGVEVFVVLQTLGSGQGAAAAPRLIVAVRVQREGTTACQTPSAPSSVT